MDDKLHGYDTQDLSPGMYATYSKTITEADIVLFVCVSGDDNGARSNERVAS